MGAKTKFFRLKVKGKLSDEALEMLTLPKDTLLADSDLDLPDYAWTVDDIRKAVLESLASVEIHDGLSLKS